MTTSRKIALLFGAENINAIIGWIALLFVARKMGATALGEFSYALSLVGGFTFLAFLGFNMAHIKRVSEGQDLGKCIGTFITIRLFLLSLMLTVFAFFYWLWHNFLDKQLYDTTPEMLFLVVIYCFLVFLSPSEPLVSYMPVLVSVPGLYTTKKPPPGPPKKHPGPPKQTFGSKF